MNHCHSNRKRLYAIFLTLLVLFSVSQSLVYKVNASDPPPPTNNNMDDPIASDTQKPTAKKRAIAARVPVKGRGIATKVPVKVRGTKTNKCRVVKRAREPVTFAHKSSSKSKSNTMKELEESNVIEEAKKYKFSDEEKGYDESRLYSEGKQCLENSKTRIKACAFLLRAADKNYIEAVSTLLINFYDFIEQSQKEHYLTSIFSAEDEKVIFELVYFLFSKDIASYKDKIIKTINRFAERGDKEACFLLGKIYFELSNSDEDIDISQKYLNTAITGYNFRSKDNDKIEWLQKCEEMLLSIHLSENKKITSDYCSLFEYYKVDDSTLDIKKLSVNACLFCGLVYFEGSESIKVDYEKAFLFCSEAAKRYKSRSHPMLALICVEYYNESPEKLEWDEVKGSFQEAYEKSYHIDQIQNFLECYALADEKNVSKIFLFYKENIKNFGPYQSIKKLLKKATDKFGYDAMVPLYEEFYEIFRDSEDNYFLGKIYCDNVSEDKLDFDKAMSFFIDQYKCYKTCFKKMYKGAYKGYINKIQPRLERCALTSPQNVKKLFEFYKEILSEARNQSGTKEKLWEKIKSLLEKAINKFGYDAVSWMLEELFDLYRYSTIKADSMYFLGKIYAENTDKDKLDLTKAITFFEYKYKSYPPNEVKTEIEQLLKQCALTNIKSVHRLLKFYKKVSTYQTTNNDQLFDAIKNLLIESTKKFGLSNAVTPVYDDFYKFYRDTSLASNAESLLSELYHELLIKKEEINYTEAISYFKSMYRLGSITQEHRTAIESVMEYLAIKTNNAKDLFGFYSEMVRSKINTPDQTYELLKRIFNKSTSHYPITSLCEMFRYSCHNEAKTGYFLGKVLSQQSLYALAIDYFKSAYLARLSNKDSLAKVEDHLQECALRVGDSAIHDLVAFYKKVSTEYDAIEKLMEYVVICRKDYMITNKFLEGVYDKQAIEYQTLTNKLLQKYVEQMIKSGDEYSQTGNIQDALEKYQIAANNGSILAMCKFIDLCNSVTRNLNKKINQTKSRFERNLDSLEEEQIWQVIRYYETKKDCIKTFIDYCSKLGPRGIDHAIEYIRQNYTSSENIKDFEVLLTELKKISPKDEKVFAYLFEILYSGSCSLIEEKKYSLAEHLLTFITCDEMSEYNKKIPQCFLMLGKIYFGVAEGSQKPEDIQKALKVLNESYRQAQVLTDAEKDSVVVMLESLYKSAQDISGIISFYSDILQGNFNEEIVSRAKAFIESLVARVEEIQSYLDVIKLRSCVKYCVDEDEYEQTIKDIDAILKEKSVELIKESKLQEALSILKIIDEEDYHKQIILSEEIKDLELKKQSVKYIIEHGKVDSDIKNLCVEICINLAKSKLDQGQHRQALEQYELAADMGSVVAKFEYLETANQVKILRPKRNSFHRHAIKQSFKYQIELEQISDIQDLIEIAKLYQQRMQMSFNDYNFKKFVLYCMKSKSDGTSLLMTKLMEWFNDENHSEEMYHILSKCLSVEKTKIYIKVTLKFLAFLDDKDHTSLQQKITQLLSKNFPKDSIKYSLLQRLSSNKDSLVKSKVFEFWKNSIKHREIDPAITCKDMRVPKVARRSIWLSEVAKKSIWLPKVFPQNIDAKERNIGTPGKSKKEIIFGDCFIVKVCRNGTVWHADYHGQTLEKAMDLFYKINKAAADSPGVELVNHLSGQGHHSKNNTSVIRKVFLSFPYATLDANNPGIVKVRVEDFKGSPHYKNP